MCLLARAGFGKAESRARSRPPGAQIPEGVPLTRTAPGNEPARRAGFGRGRILRLDPALGGQIPEGVPLDAGRAAQRATRAGGTVATEAAAATYAVAVALYRIQPNLASGIVGSARSAATPASSSVAVVREVSASPARVLSTTEAA
jgi:hypothetical protein